MIENPKSGQLWRRKTKLSFADSDLLVIVSVEYDEVRAMIPNYDGTTPLFSWCITIETLHGNYFKLVA